MDIPHRVFWGGELKLEYAMGEGSSCDSGSVQKVFFEPVVINAEYVLVKLNEIMYYRGKVTF